MCSPGISSDTVVRPSTVSQEELLELIDKMNRDWRVSGLLVQLPLPGEQRHHCSRGVLHDIMLTGLYSCGDSASIVDGYCVHKILCVQNMYWSDFWWLWGPHDCSELIIIFKKPVWDYLNFVMWHVILLEAAIRRGVHCSHKGMVRLLR